MVGRVSPEKQNGYKSLTGSYVRKGGRNTKESKVKNRPDAPASMNPENHERKYLPTLSDLVDRLTIVQQKMIFIPERADEYRHERALILHDIDLLLQDGPPLTAKAILSVALLALTNRVIWENESKARAGGNEQDKLLKLTHSINGVRNTAKNMLSEEFGGRHDYKIDALAADLPEEFGNWRIFTDVRDPLEKISKA